MKLFRAFFALALLWPVVSLAQTPKSKSTLQSEINSSFPDNTVGQITPAIVRGVFSDFLVSWQQYAAVNAQVGTTYTIQATDYGQLVTFNNGSPVAVTLPQASSSFLYFNAFVSNKGAGTVTITPTTSTINGGANIALSQNQGAWIVSDTVNYQALIFSLSGTNVPSGTPTNILNTQTSNYTIQNTDCGKTIQAGTGTTGYFKVTLPAVAGFAGTCVVTVKNGDTGRGKALSGFPADIPTLVGSSPSISMLWPLQTVQVGIVNGAWATLVHPGRWKLTATTNMYWDSGASGKDDGTTDGLASGSAFLTPSHAYAVDQQNFDHLNCNAIQLNVVQATVTLAVGQTLIGTLTPSCDDQVFVILGAGAGSTTIQSTAASVTNFQAQSGATFLVKNMTIKATGAGSFCLVSSQSQIGIDGVTALGCAAGFADVAAPRGVIQGRGAGAIIGAGTYNIVFIAEDHAQINWPVALTINGSPAFTTAFVQSDLGGMNDWSNSTITKATETGARYSAGTLGIVFTGGSGGANYFPGNANGTCGASASCVTASSGYYQ